MSAVSPKLLIWIGSSRDHLRGFPEEVRAMMGHALYMAQCGLKHESAKPLKGLVAQA
jgi:phage-related protein